MSEDSEMERGRPRRTNRLSRKRGDYALLQDWPGASRNSSHAVALNACKAGIAGEIDAETVRSTFVAFARRNDILVPDMDALMPAVSTASSPSANTRT